MKLSIKKTTLIALLSAFSLVVYVIESALPPIIPAVSGARLGLSNIFVMYALYALGWQSAIYVVVIKSLLGPIFAGSPTAMFFSLSGSLLSLSAMTLLKNLMKEKIGLIGVSVSGALMHNIGQTIMAILFTSSFSVILYFPVLALISVPCGIIIGVAADRILKLTSGISLKHKKKNAWRKMQ